MNKKILITGAGGYIGSVATQYFLKKNYHVVAFDNFSTGFKQPLEYLRDTYGAEKVAIYSGQIASDIAGVLQKENSIEAVIHFAAKCSVDESMKSPGLYFLNNTMSTQALLDAMLASNIKKIIFSSTCAVYGKTTSETIDETHTTQPTNPYGESKLLSEQMLSWYQKLSGIQYLTLRYFNVCGASDDGMIGDSKKPSVHLVQNAVRAALGIEDFYLTSPHFNTPDGTSIRDYVNVVDLAKAHIAGLEYLYEHETSEIVNIGTGRGNSVLEIIQAVERCTGSKLTVNQAPHTRKGEYPRMVASFQKAEKLLGWRPEHDLASSIQSLVNWYTRYPHGWEH